MRLRAVLFVLLLAIIPQLAPAQLLPGFRLEKIADASGFLTSLAFDSNGRLFYSVTSGEIYRVALDGSSELIATVPTAVEGNAVLLGIAFLPDDSIVAKYVLPDLTADVVSRIDPSTGIEEIVALLHCPGGGACPSEHHGGNPSLAPDGSIFFGIGDFGAGMTAQDPLSPAGKIFRISPGGEISMFALGLRNPYDMVFDPKLERLVVADNGPVAGDEIHILDEGDNAGWPLCFGEQSAPPGTVAPDYVFPFTEAPTGVALVTEHASMPDGLLVGSFVGRTLYFFPNHRAEEIREPVALWRDVTESVMDVVQRADGIVVVADAVTIYRLIPPECGDANGDGRIDGRDLDALIAEIHDGDGNETVDAHLGFYPGSWGADVNCDGVIDERDLQSLEKLRKPRRRGARRP